MQFEVTVTKPAAGGGCVGRAPDGRVVFVRHAIAGERVIADVTDETSTFLRADAIEILDASPDRVTPPCSLSGPGGCGGCDYQHIAIDRQRALKAELVAEQLLRIAGVERDIECLAAPGDVDGLKWRTRVRFSIDANGNAGFHQARGDEVIAVRSCPVLTDELTHLGLTSQRWLGATSIEAFGHPDGDRTVVAITTTEAGLDFIPDVGDSLQINGHAVHGDGPAHVTINGHRFISGAQTFFQAHKGAADVLTAAVLAQLQPTSGGRYGDLYAGVGLFTGAILPLVLPRGRVIAVEQDRRSATLAARALKGQKRFEVLTEAVTDALIAERFEGFDGIVLDPPRDGAGRAVMQSLAALNEPPTKVVYVSCDAATFARDLKVLLDVGWTLDHLEVHDLFPMTEHVELVGTIVPPK